MGNDVSPGITDENHIEIIDTPKLKSDDIKERLNKYKFPNNTKPSPKFVSIERVVETLGNNFSPNIEDPADIYDEVDLYGDVNEVDEEDEVEYDQVQPFTTPTSSVQINYSSLLSFKFPLTQDTESSMESYSFPRKNY
ncbi:hypothetical protein AKO1_006760 [Acrasis kona]|uniref:Uncharacterized protein n=1 Tax=Acrasis kona TaxID=1008807 RepID=A0AAW2YUP0_9EUKA